jgi:hypothetical protein
MVSTANKKGKISESHEMNHHRDGLRYGARQANKKIMARIKFRTIRNFFVKVRNLLAIPAIYKSEW